MSWENLSKLQSKPQERGVAIARAQAAAKMPTQKELVRKTVEEVFKEYCEKGVEELLKNLEKM